MSDIVRCPNCGQANRLPAAGAGKTAVCGKCKTPNKVRTPYCVKCATPLTDVVVLCSSCGTVQRDTVVCTESCCIRKRRVDFSYSDLTCIWQRDKCFRDFGREQILTF